MPFNVSSSINYLGDKTVSIPIIKTIAENPIYTALIISIIIMLIIIIIFRNTESDDPLYVMTTRAGFWIFLFTIFIIFLHDKILSTENSSKSVLGQYQDLFNDKNFLTVDKVNIEQPKTEQPVSILKKEPTYDINAAYQE